MVAVSLQLCAGVQHLSTSTTSRFSIPLCQQALNTPRAPASVYVRSLALKRRVVLVFFHHNEVVSFRSLDGSLCVCNLSCILLIHIHSIDNSFVVQAPLVIWELAVADAVRNCPCRLSFHQAPHHFGKHDHSFSRVDHVGLNGCSVDCVSINSSVLCVVGCALILHRSHTSACRKRCTRREDGHHPTSRRCSRSGAHHHHRHTERHATSPRFERHEHYHYTFTWQANSYSPTPTPTIITRVSARYPRTTSIRALQRTHTHTRSILAIYNPSRFLACVRNNVASWYKSDVIRRSYPLPQSRQSTDREGVSLHCPQAYGGASLL